MPALTTGMGAKQPGGSKWPVLAVLLAGAMRSIGRLLSTSVAVGSAEREEGSIRPGFVDRPGDHRVGE
jgi:hypothetical protein